MKKLFLIIVTLLFSVCAHAQVTFASKSTQFGYVKLNKDVTYYLYPDSRSYEAITEIVYSITGAYDSSGVYDLKDATEIRIEKGTKPWLAILGNVGSKPCGLYIYQDDEGRWVVYVKFNEYIGNPFSDDPSDEALDNPTQKIIDYVVAKN